MREREIQSFTDDNDDAIMIIAHVLIHIRVNIF